MNSRKIDISEAFNSEWVAKLNVGQTVSFQSDDGKHDYRIVKIKNERVWAKEIKLYKPEQFTISDKRKPSDKAKWVDKVTKK